LLGGCRDVHHQSVAARARSRSDTSWEIDRGVPRAGGSSTRIASSRSLEIGWRVRANANTWPSRLASGVPEARQTSIARMAASIAA
jgi:hypothetical protein